MKIFADKDTLDEVQGPIDESQYSLGDILNKCNQAIEWLNDMESMTLGEVGDDIGALSNNLVKLNEDIENINGIIKGVQESFLDADTDGRQN